MEDEDEVIKLQIAYHKARKEFVEADKTVWRLGDALRNAGRVLAPSAKEQGANFFSEIAADHRAIVGMPAKPEVADAVVARSGAAEKMFGFWFAIPKSQRDECSPLPVKLTHRDQSEMEERIGAKE